jgi:hypothetical protein
VTIKATSEAKLLKYFLTSWGEDDEWVQERIDSITVEESTDEFVSGVFTHEWTADESDLVLTPFPSPAYLIESEWYYVTKGEIDLREDTALRTLALSMFTAARDSVDNDASSQVDMAGNEIDVVTDREIAQRVCRSLSTMYWGW